MKLPFVCHVAKRSMHLFWSPNSRLSKTISDRYRKVPLPDCKAQVTYVWIDGTGESVRSKTKILDVSPASPKDCPIWDFDGASANFSTNTKSEIVLCPVALYNDPITQPPNKIVLCETYTYDGKPTKSNYRHCCVEALNRACDKEPMFGFEQEFQLMDANQRPFGWPMMMGEPAPSGPYYCGVGADRAWGREISEAHCRCCLNSGVALFGTNAEVSPSQWEFQTAPTVGIKAGDDLWMARYLLYRIAEDYGVGISLHPKLFPHWIGAGCHVGFSTKTMREDGGFKDIEEAAKKLEKKHKEHIDVYELENSSLNKLRLTGKYETSSIEKFTWGIGDRGASVRISNKVAQMQKGYLEDRRPSSNCDPYRVMNALVRTIILDE